MDNLDMVNKALEIAIAGGVGVTLRSDELGKILGKITELEAENAELRTRLELARIAYEKLINYRDHNVLNFQLEKADDFIRMIRDAVTPPEDGNV